MNDHKAQARRAYKNAFSYLAVAVVAFGAFFHFTNPHKPMGLEGILLLSAAIYCWTMCIGHLLAHLARLIHLYAHAREQEMEGMGWDSAMYPYDDEDGTVIYDTEAPEPARLRR